MMVAWSLTDTFWLSDAVWGTCKNGTSPGIGIEMGVSLVLGEKAFFLGHDILLKVGALLMAIMSDWWSRCSDVTHIKPLVDPSWTR